MALTLYEERLCGGCGQPMDLTTSTSTLGHWHVEKRRCLGCERAAQAEKAQGENPPPGIKTWVNYQP